jgi:methyl-accepting chemotaxis protein
LCSSVGSGGGLSVGGSLSAGLEGEAGGGVTWIGKINAQAALSAGVSINAGVSSTVGISTSNCLALIDTKKPPDFSSFSSEEQYFYDALVSSTLGAELDTNELALNIMKQAVNMQSSLATSRVVLANFGVINKTISTMITEGDPLDFNNFKSSLIRIADNSSDLLHPRLKRTMLHLDQAFARHVSNIDVLGRSCDDLHSGSITHLPELMISRLSKVCDDWKAVQGIVETFIDDVNGTFEKTDQAAKQMAALAKNGKTLQGLVGTFNTSVQEVTLTANAIGGSVSQLSDTVSQSKEVISKSVDGASSIITNSINVMGETVQKVNGAASNAGSFASTGLQDLKGEVDTTVTLIQGLSFGRIAALPAKIATKVLDTIASTTASVTATISGAVCDKGISLGFGVSVSVKDIPGVKDVLGCN